MYFITVTRIMLYIHTYVFVLQGPCVMPLSTIKLTTHAHLSAVFSIKICFAWFTVGFKTKPYSDKNRNTYCPDF